MNSLLVYDEEGAGGQTLGWLHNFFMLLTTDLSLIQELVTK